MVHEICQYNGDTSAKTMITANQNWLGIFHIISWKRRKIKALFLKTSCSDIHTALYSRLVGFVTTRKLKKTTVDNKLYCESSFFFACHKNLASKSLKSPLHSWKAFCHLLWLCHSYAWHNGKKYPLQFA